MEPKVSVATPGDWTHRFPGQAVIEWAEPGSGIMSVRCSCGNRMVLRQLAITQRVENALRDFESNFDEARKKFRRQSSRRFRNKKSSKKKIRELKVRIRALLKSL